MKTKEGIREKVAIILDPLYEDFNGLDDDWGEAMSKLCDLIAQAKQRTIKEIINKLESEGVDTPLGKLTPQEIDFVIAKIKI